MWKRLAMLGCDLVPHAQDLQVAVVWVSENASRDVALDAQPLRRGHEEPVAKVLPVIRRAGQLPESALRRGQSGPKQPRCDCVCLCFLSAAEMVGVGVG